MVTVNHSATSVNYFVKGGSVGASKFAGVGGCAFMNDSGKAVVFGAGKNGGIGRISSWSNNWYQGNLFH